MTGWTPPTNWTDGLPVTPSTETLPELLLAQAARTPDATAIVQWDRSLTYREFTDAAHDLAAVLRSAGVRPETRVGVCVHRTPDLPVTVLGILLAGGAYVPLDPSQPVRRLTTILDDAAVDVVVTDTDLLTGTGRLLVPPAGHPVSPHEPPTVRPDHAAYVLYTSGSTGTPKGVVVSHRNAVAFGVAVRACRPTGPGCRSAGFASLSFDASVFDMIHPLGTGATVALLPEPDRVDPVRLQRFLAEHRVTRAMLPPAVLPLLDPAALPDLADLFVAGEPTGPEQVARWAVGGRRFHNWYGPTETTVIVTAAELSGTWTQPLPIGRPIPGCRAYVLDENHLPCPPGEPGELCIGGPQVTRGYLGRPGHTADRFIPDPFGPPGSRLYRTGDHVSWQPDGRIAFGGRLDRQVKIHGQRVEIGELETVLTRHPAIRQATVDVVRDESGARLVAYLSPADAPDLAEVRAYCGELLPGYMAPNRVVRLPALPLNVFGKVDLAALRAAEPDATPVIRAGTTVAGVWAEVFGGPEPGPDTEFNAAGGHSLLAMRLVSALRARFGRAVEVADVYACRTVGALAERVGSADPIDDTVPTGSPAALSPMQRRLWFVEQLSPGVPAHNIPLAQRIRGRLDEPALRAALRAVATRQEVLRWRMPAADGTPTVLVDPPGDVPLTITDLTGLPPDERPAALRDRLDRTATGVFDLAAGPLWRAELIRLGEDEHVLALTVHHIVFDGWSVDVLYREITAAYQDTAPAPAAGFADYVAWSAARQRDRGPADLDWWVEHLADVPTVLDLPGDRPRPAVQTFRGARAEIRIEPPVAERIREFAGANDTTSFVVLLAAFGHLAGRLAGRSEVVVGTPLVDRRNAAFESVIGCCLAMLPLRLHGSTDLSFTGQVRAARDEFAAAVAHQDVSLAGLVDAIGGTRDLSRNPLIQVLFNCYDFTTPHLDLPGTTAEPLTAGLPGSLYDLTCYAGDRDGGIDLQVVYNPDLFDADRITALLTDYRSLLDQLTTAPDRPAALHAPVVPVEVTAEPPDLLARIPVTDRVAVTGAGGELTYARLADLANRTTAAVIAAGPPDAVAVLAARDVRLPAVLCGLLAGGTRWLVVDPVTPPTVNTAAAAAVSAKAQLRLPGVTADLGLPDLELPDVAEPGTPATDRGYHSLTSGSTGAPRPVLTGDGPLAHFLAWYPATFGLTEHDRFALLGGLAHDPMLRDVFTPLVLGATLGVPAPELLREPDGLAAWLAAERTTVLHLTPQLARLLAGTGAVLPDVRLALLGGDQLLDTDVPALRRLLPAARLVNGYGTTETPQVQAYHELSPATAEPGGLPVPVGRGAPGTRLVVRTPAGLSAGVGELGEVLVVGPHLATGYVDAEQTGDRFGVDPVLGRYFRTGDLGRHTATGDVVLAGRADDQVKIRGFRVELGAVRAVLAAHPDVRAAHVLAVPDGGDRKLRGYAVPNRAGVRGWQVRDDLRGRLPEYALPADIVLLAELPLTRNGKVDQAALLRAGAATDRGPGAELTGHTQRVIAGVWSEVLGLPRPGATDNFFEVGGHSLAVVVVRDRLAGLLGRPIPVVDLFRHPTIHALAAHLDGGGRDNQVERAVSRAARRRARRRVAGADRAGTVIENEESR